ncbi:hypothetical protein [Cohnella cholangitidis]|uniref:hypothetical protein n=1 Tax=Cohnella cholangitidis TaxID=2598458 RepID=UPI0015FAA908|nr:hypothetical protein [Cohnella cholangitidis]
MNESRPIGSPRFFSSNGSSSYHWEIVGGQESIPIAEWVQECVPNAAIKLMYDHYANPEVHFSDRAAQFFRDLTTERRTEGESRFLKKRKFNGVKEGLNLPGGHTPSKEILVVLQQAIP